MSKQCDELHKIFNSMHRYRFPFDKKTIPQNGIYILFEDGEKAHGVDRIVRIGTHTGKDQLPSRLQQHFIMENKDRSTFRKNIGRAILNKRNDEFLRQWEIDLTPKASRDNNLKNIDIKRLNNVEKEVSKYMQENFSFAVFAVDDKKQRLELESKIISTVSLCKECNHSKDWLGNFSPKEKIRKSGLWLVNELYKEPLTVKDIDIIKNLIKQ